MSRKVVLLAAICLMAIPVGNPAARAADVERPFRLSLLVGYQGAGHDDLQNTIEESRYLVEAIVDSLNAEQGSVISHAFNTDDMTGGLTAGLRAEYQLNEDLLIGIEGLRLSGSGGSDYSYAYEDSFELLNVTEATEYDVTGILVAAHAAYLTRPFAGPVTVRMGGGVGVIRGHLDIASSGFRETGYHRDTARTAHGFAATGYGVAYSAFMGGEYQVTEKYYVTADVGYRFASVGKLSVDNVDGMTRVHENETLVWDREDGFTTDAGSEVGLDFSGVYLTVGIGMMF